MTVYIKKRPNERYKWVVMVGKGRGGIIKSRHRYKRRALKKGREVAKRRGDVLKQQMDAGYWQTVREY